MRIKVHDITERDAEIIRVLNEVGLGTREQLQKLLFSVGGRSRCQARLSLLTRMRYIEALPRSAVNEPVVYFVGGRAVRGRRLLRAMLGPEARVGSNPTSGIAHRIAVTDCRVHLLVACRATGYRLSAWLSERELEEMTRPGGIRPDAYFQVARGAAENERTASFFLEVERSAKGKRALTEKVRRFGEFYYGGGYERAFGTRALRVLYVVGSDYGLSPAAWIASMADVCSRAEVTFFRFAPLSEFLSTSPAEVLFAPIWRHPGDEGLAALFEAHADG